MKTTYLEVNVGPRLSVVVIISYKPFDTHFAQLRKKWFSAKMSKIFELCVNTLIIWSWVDPEILCPFVERGQDNLRVPILFKIYVINSPSFLDDGKPKRLLFVAEQGISRLWQWIRGQITTCHVSIFCWNIFCRICISKKSCTIPDLTICTEMVKKWS